MEKTQTEEINQSRKDLQDLSRIINKILRQKYLLCAVVSLAIDTIETNRDNNETGQWMDTLIRELEQALKEAVL